MTEEKRNAVEAGASNRRAGSVGDSRPAPVLGAERDMREILSSIRKLMKDTPAPDPSAPPASRRREEKASGFETVAPPPAAPVDEWPDDPQIDVDALAEELLREASTLATRRGAGQKDAQSQSETTSASDGPAASPKIPDQEAPEQEAWGELDALLSYAQDALELGDEAVAQTPAREASPPARPQDSALETDLGTSELVAYPTEAVLAQDADPIDEMPDLSEVLKTASVTISGESAPEVAAPGAEDVGETSESEPRAGVAEDLQAAPNQTASDDHDAAEAQEAGPVADPVADAAVPDAEPAAEEPDLSIPSPSHSPTPERAPAADTVPAPPPTPIAASRAPLAASRAPLMPDDPRNAPRPLNPVLDQIAAMVRDKARQNLEEGVSTYEGRDPHPRIVEKTGWRRGPTGPHEAGPQEPDPTPSLSPTDLALKALDQVDANAIADQLEERVETGASAENLRPVLAEWLDQNLPRLIEELVREEMKRLAKREGPGPD